MLAINQTSFGRGGNTMKARILLMIGAIVVVGAVGVWPSSSSKYACAQTQEDITDTELKSIPRGPAFLPPRPLPEGCVLYYYTGLGNDPVPAEPPEKTP
jgi:hypothetical protein